MDNVYQRLIEQINEEKKDKEILKENFYTSEKIVGDNHYKPPKDATKKLYIILTRTKSNIGKVINTVMGSEYNHASLSFDRTLKNAYSFAKIGGNLLTGGFRQENYANSGYKGALYCIMELPVTEKQFNSTIEIINLFKKNKNKFDFDRLGLLLSGLNIPSHKKNKFFCSNFVSFVLLKSGIRLFCKDYALVRPNDYLINSALKKVEEGTIERKIAKEHIKNLTNETLVTDEDEYNYFLNEAATSNKSKRKKIESLVYNVFSMLDVTGLNTEHYKKKFSSMSDEKFNSYIKKFLNNDDDNFYLEVLPNKNEPKMTDIKKALKLLDAPTEEYVYFKDGVHKDDPLRTRVPVPVGYLNVRRMEQILSKKNTFSLDIDSRSMKTGQVTAHDKIARISDMETYSLSAIGADKALEEFLGPRADNFSAKKDLYKDISLYGYSYLKDQKKDITENQTLNSIYTYLIGSGLENDLLKEDTEEKDK